MLGEATGKTELDWLMGGSSSRVLALPEGLSLGPIPPVVHLAEGKCEPCPMPDASPCTQGRTRAPGQSPPLHTHFLWLLPAVRKPPWAISPTLFLSSLSWKCCLFSVSLPPRLPVTVSVPAVWLPATHTPGTSLVKVTMASVPLTGFNSLTWPPCSIREG